ncbi:MAG TPA: HAMP domain-containing sensor histidine kinase [Acidobacteriota bacterium]
MGEPGARRPNQASFIVLLLAGTLLLVAALAWQAHDAARTQRAVAERVLRDYAGLAAEELARRCASTIGYYGFHTLLTALRPPAERGAKLAALDELRSSGDQGLRRAAALARYVFRIPIEGEAVETSGPVPAPEVVQWLRDQARRPEVRSRGGEIPFAFLSCRLAGRFHRFVYAVTDPAGGRSAQMIGFELDLQALQPWFQSALERGPLLPPSVSRGEVTNAALFIRLVGPAGRELFRSGREAWTRTQDGSAADLSVELALDDYYEGVLQGMVVEVALDPEVAPKLVIGGLPRTRLPALLVLLGLTVGLVGAAILLLRRTQALARLRADFVSRVSHELRTPLTQIRLFGETLLLDRVRSESERRQALQVIDREARRLGQLVENVLTFSRSERRALRLKPAPLSIVPLVRDLIAEFAPLARGAKLSLVCALPETQQVIAEPDALRQVLLNLLDNAVKYGPAAQAIRVALAQVDSAVRISVEDQGPGIPAAERERIWQSYRRLERDRDSAVGGAGIGLAVVRELLALQGGRAWVEAGASGGARFVAELAAAGAERDSSRP